MAANSNKIPTALLNPITSANAAHSSHAGTFTATGAAENQPELPEATASCPVTQYQPKWQPKWQPKSRQNRNKQPSSSRNQQQLDQQIWQLHQAIVEKMLQQPAHASRLLQQLESRYQQGQLRHAPYLFWSSCLLQIDQPDLFRQAVLSNQPQAIKYRRRTALTGVLTEHERQTVLFAGTSATQINPND